MSHVWISEDRVVAGTNSSKLLVFDQGDLVMEILYVLPSNEQSPPSFDFVTAYSGGVLAGTSTGVCIMFEKTDDDLLYKKTREFIMEPSGVSTIAVRPSDDSAVCTLKNSQIYSISLDADSSKVRKRSVANL